MIQLGRFFLGRRLIAILLGVALLTALSITLAQRSPVVRPLAASAANAGNATWTITIKGAKQGPFKSAGSSAKFSKLGATELASLSWGVQVPREIASGQSVGRRQHKPFTFTLALGATTAQLAAAAVSNELLNAVVVDGYAPSPDGSLAKFMEYRLTNATISELTDEVNAPERGTERVSLGYQKLEIEDLVNRTLAVDDATGR